MKKGLIKFPSFFIIACCYITVLLTGCASLPEKPDVVAYVDDDPVTIGDIEYSLQIAHRREGLSKTSGIDISDYLNKVIDERLLVHEAMRMNMALNPEIKQKVDEYILNESVSRLYNDEVLSKVHVTDEEILERYKKEYVPYTLSYMATNSVEVARGMSEKIRSGMDFDKLAAKFSGQESNKSMMNAVFVRKDLSKALRDVIDGLEPDESSDVFGSGGKYYLLKLVSRGKSNEKEFALHREEISESIKKDRISARSDEYLDSLRKKMKPDINHALLSLISADADSGEYSKWLHDGRALITLRDSMLTVGKFAEMLRREKGRSKDKIIRQWINRKVVDYESLDRRYTEKSGLKEQVTRYRNKIIMKMFIKKVLYPKVELSEGELTDYYNRNRTDFFRPARYKIQQITSRTKDDAEMIRSELIKGADFSWMARNRSYDSYSSDGGNIGWREEGSLPEELKGIIEDISPGEVSDVLRSGGFFRIYRIQEKTGRELKEFKEVRQAVRRKVFEVKYKELYSSIVRELKEDANIVIDDGAVDNLDRRINEKRS